MDVRVTNNLKFGIRVVGTSKVSIDQSQVLGTGFRTGSGAVGTPSPGDGISFEDSSFGAVFRTEVSASFGAGIVDQSTNVIKIQDVYLFANSPNQVGF